MYSKKNYLITISDCENERLTINIRLKELQTRNGVLDDIDAAKKVIFFSVAKDRNEYLRALDQIISDGHKAGICFTCIPLKGCRKEMPVPMPKETPKAVRQNIVQHPVLIRSNDRPRELKLLTRTTELPYK